MIGQPFAKAWDITPSEEDAGRLFDRAIANREPGERLDWHVRRVAAIAANVHTATLLQELAGRGGA